MNEALESTARLGLARRIVEQTGANLFLTGKAGTGKTTFLRCLREESKKRMVVLAPSGVAAINAQGQTIHSFFQFPLSLYIPGQGFAGEKNYMSYSRERRRIISTLDLLVIDEISMVRADLLDAIDNRLRRLRRDPRPFGGVQLLLIGDLRQLSPVVREQEWQIMREHYASPYFFESRALKEAGLLTVELDTIFRQSDPRFIAMLNAVREGQRSRAVLDAINSRHGAAPADDEGYIRLTTHNNRARDINDGRLGRLVTAPTTFGATIKGKFPESAYPADATLTLKQGAQVMFLKNDTSEEHRYYNGMLGTVIDLLPDRVTVAPFDGSHPITVEPAKWENAQYTIDDETQAIRLDIEGTFEQLPLRLAWAITIHKSQGLTFDRAIIDAASSFAPGQAYVALSRCRSLDGIVLETPIPPHAIITDPTVNNFIEDARRSEPDEETLRRLSEAHFRDTLHGLFDFDTLVMQFGDFTRTAEEYVVPMHRELHQPLMEASEALQTRVGSVADRFMSLYNHADLTDPAVKARIRSGCAYFLEELVPLMRLLADMPRDVENKAFRRRLENSYQNLLFTLRLKARLMRGMARCDFSPETFNAVKTAALLEIEAAGDAPAKSAKTAEKRELKEKKPKEKKPKGYSQYESLRMFRNGKDIATIAAERGLTETTVAYHLAEMAAAGELEWQKLIDPATAERLQAIYEHASGNAGGLFMAARAQGISQQQAQIFNRLKKLNAI